MNASSQADYLFPMLPRPEIEIDQLDFKEWLEARRSSVVGVSCEDGSCPASAYLSQVHHRHYMVGNDMCGPYSAPTSRRLPAWLAAFVHRLDATQSYMENEVLGEEALQVYEWAISHAHPLFASDDEGNAAAPARVVAGSSSLSYEVLLR